jgi:isopenicillin N synthase-like dioxygenase
MRIGEHSDYGTITLLWQINDVPGLEVQDLGGAWHPVPYAEDGVVVNIGDLLQRWTNDYFVSTKHRVVNTHIDQTRYSMPHFVDPTPGTIVQNLRNEPNKYDPIESKEYLMWRLAQSY